MKLSLISCGIVLLIACSSYAGENKAITISSQPQLFLDDCVVAKLVNLKRQIQPPEKHPANPLIVSDQPWETRYIQAMGPVFYEKGLDTFRAWYLASSQPQIMEPEYYVCYAESKDGLHWDKPMVGQGTFHTYTRHNVVIPGGAGFCVLPTPDDPDPNKKYKGLGGAIRGYSPDGIRWTIKPFPEAKRNDTSSCVVWWKGKYYAYLRNQERNRPYWPGVIRAVGLCTSSDFETWTEKRTILTTDERDGLPWTQVYALAVTPCGDVLIGLLWLLEMDPLRGWHASGEKKECLAGPMTAQLVVSRDGENWSRVADRAPFMQPTLGTWDQGQVKPSTTMFVKDDKVYIYYTGCNTEHGLLPPRHNHPTPEKMFTAIGLATLPADRFVALLCSDWTKPPGVLETKLLNFEGTDLVINAEVPENDASHLQVELLDQGGKVLPGFSRADSHLIVRDKLRYNVVWGKKESPKTLKDATGQQPLAIRFILHRAALYAFQTSRSP